MRLSGVNYFFRRVASQRNATDDRSSRLATSQRPTAVLTARARFAPQQPGEAFLLPRRRRVSWVRAAGHGGAHRTFFQRRLRDHFEQATSDEPRLMRGKRWAGPWIWIRWHGGG